MFQRPQVVVSCHPRVRHAGLDPASRFPTRPFPDLPWAMDARSSFQPSPPSRCCPTGAQMSFSCRLVVLSLSRRRRVILTRLSRACRFTGARQALGRRIGPNLPARHCELRLSRRFSAPTGAPAPSPTPCSTYPHSICLLYTSPSPRDS